jgi:DNA-binding response OmpR family regulator
MISDTPLHVLVVEDDPFIGRAVTRGLSRAGHSLRSTQTCGAARELRESFDCAVLDMDLPDGKGVDLANELLSEGLARSVVFYTASSEQALLLRAEALGPIVQKTCGVEALIDTVNACAPASDSGRLTLGSLRRLAYN